MNVVVDTNIVFSAILNAIDEIDYIKGIAHEKVMANIRKKTAMHKHIAKSDNLLTYG